MYAAARAVDGLLVPGGNKPLFFTFFGFPPDTSHVHFKGVDGLHRSDEQGLKVFSTESDIRGPIFLNGNVANFLSSFVENGYPLTSEVEVALVI